MLQAATDASHTRGGAPTHGAGLLTRPDEFESTVPGRGGPSGGPCRGQVTNGVAQATEDRRSISGDCARGYVSVELPALGRCSLPARHARGPTPRPVHAELRDRRAQRQLLRWPADRTFAGWRRRLPEGFLLSVKASRGPTHAQRLYSPQAWVDRLSTSSGNDAKWCSSSWRPDMCVTTPAWPPPGPAAATCSSTSTTTATGTPYATPAPCGNSSCDRVTDPISRARIAARQAPMGG